MKSDPLQTLISQQIRCFSYDFCQSKHRVVYGAAPKEPAMPALSELIKTISRAVRIPEKDVTLYARRLREAGLLPQSAGRSHPEVDHKDCARALLASDNARNAPDAVRAYEPLVDRLSEILSDIDWAEKIEGTRVNRSLGEVNITDLSGKARRPGKFLGRKDVPEQSQSMLQVTASLPKGVLYDIAGAMNDRR